MGEDPKNLLDPKINGYSLCPTIDFSTATWGNVFEYSMNMCVRLRKKRFNRLFSENATEFMKTLAISAAQNCPLDFQVLGRTPLWCAMFKNDVDVASTLLRRRAVIGPLALAYAVSRCNPEMVKILLENGADVHAETIYSGVPMPIHECCAQRLQYFETEYKRGNTAYSLYEVEKLKEINKLVMDKKRKDNHLI